MDTEKITSNMSLGALAVFTALLIGWEKKCERGAGKLIVKKTSIFPASKETVFQKLQQLETLQYIAWPYATFKPIGKAVHTWTVGSTSSYRFRLFGLIPFGTHTIHIVRFDPDGVSSREGNEHVPVWNHDIRLIEKDENHTQYTDRVEIHAGWKTAVIWLWANAFYRHRQRKWIRLLRRKKRSTDEKYRTENTEGNARETS